MALDKKRLAMEARAEQVLLYLQLAKISNEGGKKKPSE